MIDTALAASALNLDAPAQGKLGAKSDKADDTGKKHAFADALKQHGTGKQAGHRQAPVGQGTQAPVADDAIENDASAKLPAEEPASSPPAATPKKPAFLLSQALAKTARSAQAPLAEPATTAAKAQVKFDIRHGTSGAKGAAAPTADGGVSGQAAEDHADELAQTGSPLKPDAKTPRVSRHAAKADAADEAPAHGKDDPVQSHDAPAKDALGLLGANSQREVAAGTHAPSAASGDSADNAPAAPGPSASYSYRVSRADGKGGVLDIPAHDATTEGDKALPVTQSSGQVTVLDQRRYLAPAQDNALSVINTIAGDREWAAAMQPDSSLANAAAIAGGGKVVNTLKIQMHPIDLGPVIATMRLTGEELTVDLKVETGAAYRQLKEDQSKIVEALKSQGFSVDQVTISMAPDRGDAGGSQTGGQTNNGQQSGQGAAFTQQQARDGGQGAAADRQRRGFQQENAGNGTVGADDGRGDTGSVRGAGGTGGVYL